MGAAKGERSVKKRYFLAACLAFSFVGCTGLSLEVVERPQPVPVYQQPVPIYRPSPYSERELYQQRVREQWQREHARWDTWHDGWHQRNPHPDNHTNRQHHGDERDRRHVRHHWHHEHNEWHGRHVEPQLRY